MKIEDILKLIDKLENSSITKVVIDEEGTKVKISKESKVIVQEAGKEAVSFSKVPMVATPAQAAPIASAPIVPVEENASEDKEEAGYGYITSPIVGTFYGASSPNTAPYIKIGSEVKAGQVVCILEAMKLMNEIESEIEGEIVGILVQNEEMVEFGQKLFKVRVK